MGANPERGETAITFGDKEYVLKFDLNSLVELEELFEGDLTGLDKMFASPQLKGRIKLIRKVLHLALQNKQPEITEEQAGALVGEAPGRGFGEQLKYLTERFSEAFSVSQMEEDEEPSEEGPKKKAPALARGG